MPISRARTPTDTARPALRGRHDVLEQLLDVTARAADGQGGACTVVGEAGIGKTTLLDELAVRAVADGMRVIRLRGVEAEVELAWSGLAELLSGMLDRVDHLAPARASAIRSALAIEGGRARGRAVRHRRGQP